MIVIGLPGTFSDALEISQKLTNAGFIYRQDFIWAVDPFDRKYQFRCLTEKVATYLNLILGDA